MNEDTTQPQPEIHVVSHANKPKPSRRRGMVLVLLATILIVAGLLYNFIRPDKATDSVTDVPQTSEIAQEVAEVSITAAGFTPATIKISQGTTVTWTNADGTARSLKSDVPGLETEEPLIKNDQFSFMFETTGTFTVYDANNPQLKSVVEVE